MFERYFNGRRATSQANIKSASKSVISALVGIAIHRGHIAGVKQPLAAYFPDVLTKADDPRRQITIEDLLTMRSGLESTSNRNYGAWVQSGNWVRYALTRRLLADPGTRMQYSTGHTHLLSAIVTRATKRTTRQFAQETLARPLGFTLVEWLRDPQGIYDTSRTSSSPRWPSPSRQISDFRAQIQGCRWQMEIRRRASDPVCSKQPNLHSAVCNPVCSLRSAICHSRVRIGPWITLPSSGRLSRPSGAQTGWGSAQSTSRRACS